MANFFSKPYFDQPFFNSPFFKGAYFHLPFFTGIGGGTSAPSVTASIMNAGDSISVHFNTAMKGTGNIKDAINIIVDSGTPIHPTAVAFSGSTMTLTVAPAVTAGQVVTWAYDDQNATERLETVGGVEADNQTYSVQNDVADEPADEPCPPCEPCEPKPKKKRAKKS